MGPLMPIESPLSPEDDRTPALIWVQETLLQKVSCTQRDKGTPFKYRGVFYSYKGAPSTYGRTPCTHRVASCSYKGKASSI